MDSRMRGNDGLSIRFISRVKGFLIGDPSVVCTPPFKDRADFATRLMRDGETPINTALAELMRSEDAYKKAMTTSHIIGFHLSIEDLTELENLKRTGAVIFVIQPALLGLFNTINEDGFNLLGRKALEPLCNPPK